MNNEKIKIHREVLTSDLIYRVKQYSHTQVTHRVNLTSWSSKVVGFSGPIMLYDLPDELIAEIKVQLLPIMGEETVDKEWTATYTLGSRFSFIPWHGDDQHVRACTVYLNTDWSRDWAGMFVYENGPDDFRVVYPEYNKAIVLYPPLPHTTTMPSIDAPLRESIQIFVLSKGAADGY